MTTTRPSLSPASPRASPISPLRRIDLLSLAETRPRLFKIHDPSVPKRREAGRRSSRRARPWHSRSSRRARVRPPLPSVQYRRRRARQLARRRRRGARPSRLRVGPTAISPRWRRRAARPVGACPCVVRSTPWTMSGVPSSLYSGQGPRLSVLKCHATSSAVEIRAGWTCASARVVMGWRSRRVERPFDWSRPRRPLV